MYLIIRALKYFVFLILNFGLLFFSRDIDIEQFQKDLFIFFKDCDEPR